MSMNSCMHIDVTQKELKGLSIGDKVSVQVTGTIKGMSAGEAPEGDWEGMPPDIRLEVDKIKILGSNTFAEMAAEDD